LPQKGGVFAASPLSTTEVLRFNCNFFMIISGRKCLTVSQRRGREEEELMMWKTGVGVSVVSADLLMNVPTLMVS
jgi:hypothetical protein